MPQKDDVTKMMQAATAQYQAITGASLRRLHDQMEPLASMENEEQVSAWWKHFAGGVRLELARASSDQPKSAAHEHQDHSGLGCGGPDCGLPRHGGGHHPLCKMAPEQSHQPNKACKADILVNSGALKLALNSLRRGTQSQQEIADELEKTATAVEPEDQFIDTEFGQVIEGLHKSRTTIAQSNAFSPEEKHELNRPLLEAQVFLKAIVRMMREEQEAEKGTAP